MEEVKYALPSLLNTVSEETSNATYVSLKGAQNVAEISYTPISGTGTSTLTWSILPASTSTLIDAVFLLSADIEIVAKPYAGGALCTMGLTTLNAWPLNRMIANMSISINGLLLSHQPYRFMSIYEKMSASEELRKRYYSMFPSRGDDEGFTYVDMATNGSNISGPFAMAECDNNQFGASRLNFSKYADTVDTPDGGNGLAGVSVSRKWHVCEPLLLNNVLRDAHASGISCINKIDITLSLVQNPERFVVCNPAIETFNAGAPPGAVAQPKNPFRTIPAINAANGLALGAVSDFAGSAGLANLKAPAQITLNHSNEKLHLRYMSASAEVPSAVKLPMTQVIPYQTSVPATLAATANILEPSKQTITLNAIKASQIPEYIIFVVRRELLNTKNERNTDPLFTISNVNLILNNQVGVLSNAQMEQLYQMSARNGYNLGFDKWRSDQCVVIVKCGEDINAGGPPGSVAQWSMQASLTIINNRNVAYPATGFATFQAECYLLFSGMLEISRDSATAKLGVLTSSVASAISEPAEDIDHREDAEGLDRTGGSFKSFFKGLYKHVLKPVSRVVLPIAEKALVGKATALLGAGDSGGSDSGGARPMSGMQHRRMMAGTKMLA